MHLFAEKLVVRIMPIAVCTSRRGLGMVIARKGRLVFVRVRDERQCAGLFGPISAFLLGLIQCLIRRLD